MKNDISMISLNPVEDSFSDNSILDMHFWDQRRKEYNIKEIDTKSYNFFGKPFAERLKPYLKPDNTKRVLEIGCVPCECLCVVAKEFKYQVYGIDFTSKTNLAADFLTANGIEDFKLFNEDFLFRGKRHEDTRIRLHRGDIRLGNNRF